MEKLNIPILPIQNLVFFPKTAVPIDIESPILIKMIKDCIKFDCPIGLSLLEDVGLFTPELPKKVCGMGIPIIMEETGQTLKVIINGIGKVKVNRAIQNYPYPVYEVEVLEDK